MTGCNALKKGDTLFCEECGLQLKVAKACKCGEEQEGSCSDALICCGKEMKKK
jgi:hypothetical protein